MLNNVNEIKRYFSNIKKGIEKEISETLSQISDLNEKIDSLKKTLESMKADKEKLNKLLDTLKGMQKETLDHFNEYKSLKEELDKKNKQRTSIKMNLKSTHPDSTGASDFYGEEKNQYMSQVSRLKSLGHETDEIKRKIKNMNLSASTTRKFDEIIEIINSLNCKYYSYSDSESLETRISNLQTSIDDINKQITTKRDLLERLRNLLGTTEIWLYLLGDNGYSIDLDNNAHVVVQIRTMTPLSINNEKYYITGYSFSTDKESKPIIRAIVIGYEEELLEVDILDFIKNDLKEWFAQQIKTSPDDLDPPR